MADRPDVFKDPWGAFLARFPKFKPSLALQQGATVGAPGVRALLTMLAMGARTPLGSSLEDLQHPERWQKLLEKMRPAPAAPSAPAAL